MISDAQEYTVFNSDRYAPTTDVKKRRQEVVGCLEASGVRPAEQNPVRRDERDTTTVSAIHQLRIALEQLGPVFSAFGRYMATRTDLLPLQDCIALSAIPDHAADLPSETVDEIMTPVIGGPVETVFLSFDPEPAESRLLTQIHNGRLLDGTPVTLKMTKALPPAQVTCDLQCLSALRFALPITEDTFEEAVTDFERILHRSMNRDDEATALISLREESPLFDGFLSPRIYHDYSSADLLMVERLPGWPAGSLIPSGRLSTEGVHGGVDPAAVARRLCCIWLYQALYRPLYPMEFLPNDILILSQFRLVFTGGVFTSLPLTAREHLWHYLIAAATPDPDSAFAFLMREMEETRQPHDPTALRNRFRHTIPFRDGSWSSLGDSDSLAEHLFLHWRLVREYGYRPRLHLLNFYRGLCTLAFITRSLAPGRDSIREGLNELRLQLGFSRMGEVTDPTLWGDMMDQYSASLIALPQKLNAVLTRASQGELAVQIPNGQPNRSSRQRNISMEVIALLCLLGAVVLLSHHFTSYWIDRIGTGLFVLLSLLIIRTICRG